MHHTRTRFFFTSPSFFSSCFAAAANMSIPAATTGLNLHHHIHHHKEKLVLLYFYFLPASCPCFLRLRNIAKTKRENDAKEGRRKQGARGEERAEEWTQLRHCCKRTRNCGAKGQENVVNGNAACLLRTLAGGG
ncbi:hypothetical protein BC567DRAFT_45708 [Phyllosticta citribraziliensis]